MTSYSEHLAIRANQKSVEAAMGKDREGWLALFADDAIVCDPMGVSPFDPAGQGHQGREAIAAFYDNVIALANTRMEIGAHKASGTHACAVPMTAYNDLGEGVVIQVDMISTYQVDDAGLITSLRAFWDWSAMEAQLAEFMS